MTKLTPQNPNITFASDTSLVHTIRKVIGTILYILLLTTSIACNGKANVTDGDVKEVTISETVEEDDPGPPPPDFKFRFATLQQWLDGICENPKPGKAIATYNISLFEGEDEYILCLTGTNTYEVSKNHTAVRIDFTPADMYFSIPMNEYKNLDRDQVLERLTSRLQDFIASKKFRECYLSNGNAITTSWSDTIWSK